MIDVLEELKQEKPFINWDELIDWHHVGEIRNSIDEDVLQKDLHIEILKDKNGNKVYSVPTLLTIKRNNVIKPFFTGFFPTIVYDCDVIRLATVANTFGWERKV